jgi:hypothetical protein
VTHRGFHNSINCSLEATHGHVVRRTLHVLVIAALQINQMLIVTIFGALEIFSFMPVMSSFLMSTGSPPAPPFVVDCGQDGTPVTPTQLESVEQSHFFSLECCVL